MLSVEGALKYFGWCWDTSIERALANSWRRVAVLLVISLLEYFESFGDKAFIKKWVPRV